MKSKVLSKRTPSAAKVDGNSRFKSIVKDCSDDALYVVMRFMRLLGMTIGEAGFFAGLYYGWMMLVASIIYHDVPSFEMRARLIETGHNYQPWTTLYANPFAWALILLSLSVFSMFCAYSMAAPYRYQTTKPGIEVKECWCCSVGMMDKAFCAKCNSFRPGWVVSWGLWFLSLCVTILFVIHDVAMFLFCFLYNSKGGK